MSRSRRELLVALLAGLAVLSLQPGVGFAQERPTQNFLVGDRALGMAGAFVGLADDASAIFHNPGGLAFLPGGTLNTSLWAAAFEVQSYEDGFATHSGQSDLTSMGFRSLPFFVAGTTRLGSGGAELRRHVLAFGAFSPYASAYDFDAQHQTAEDSALDVARLSVTHDEQAQWFGLSYAYLESAAAGYGVSVFASHWSLAHNQSQIRAADGALNQLEPGAVSASSIRLERRLVQLTFRFGALWDLTRRLRLGLMLQPPGLPGYGRVAASGVRSGVSEQDASASTLDLTDVSTSPLTAWEVRVGASTGKEEDGTFSLEGSVIGPDARTPVPQALVDWTGVEAFPQGTNVRPTLRAALGYSSIISNQFPIRGGLLGEYTVPKDADDPIIRASRTQALGAAFSIGNRFENFDLSFGVTAELSRSSILTPRYSAEGAGLFGATEVERTTVFFYLSGGSKAARLLRDAVRERLLPR